MGRVRRILQHALWRRDARDAGAVDAATLTAEADKLEAAVDRLIGGATRYPPNRGLLNHLAGEREQLFTFLGVPGVNATSWRAEQAIRPAVVTRKDLGWQPHPSRSRHLAGPRERAAHRHPAGSRSRRAAHPPAANARAIVADLAIPGR